MREHPVAGFIVLFAVFAVVERLFALHREQRVFRKGWLNDVLHFFLTPLLLQAGILFVIGLVVVLTQPLANGPLQAAVAAQPGWLQFLEALVVADLGGYAGHRMCHQVPFLWRFHKIHHSIEEMDWLASARLHPVDQVVTRSCVIIPLFMLGFTRETLGAYVVVATLQALFIHANVRLTFGPLRWIVATPEFHHWHHAADREAFDKNFSAQCPLIDLAFGTLYLPRNAMPSAYGVNEPMPTTWIRQMAYPFRKNS